MNSLFQIVTFFNQTEFTQSRVLSVMLNAYLILLLDIRARNRTNRANGSPLRSLARLIKTFFPSVPLRTI